MDADPTLENAAGQGTRLAIELGNTVQITGPTSGIRIKASLAGMVKGRCLILQIAGVESSGDLRRLFSYGDALLVRYLHEGVIFGFRTFVSGTVVEPLPLVFLNWPERIEAHSVRQSRRLDTFIPCSLNLQGERHEASIVDISAGGCQVVVLRSTGIAVPDPEQAPPVQLHIPSASEAEPRQMEGTVRRCHADPARLELGIQFQEEQVALYEQLTALLRQEA